MKVKPATRKVYMRVEGVRVGVRLDDDGRPVSVGARDDPGARGSERERNVKLAAKMAFEAALQGKRERDNATAWAESAKKRAEKVAEHPANKWLALAHAAHPNYGGARLAQHARHLAATDKIAPVKDPDERDKITPERARQFLERQRNIRE